MRMFAGLLMLIGLLDRPAYDGWTHEDQQSQNEQQFVMDAEECRASESCMNGLGWTRDTHWWSL